MLCVDHLQLKADLYTVTKITNRLMPNSTTRTPATDMLYYTPTDELTTIIVELFYNLL